MSEHEHPGGTTTPRDPWTSSQSEATQAQTAKPDETKDAGAGPGRGEWERDLVNRLAFAALNEQRRSRRWNVFFKSLLFIYLFVILILLLPKKGADLSLGQHTAVIEIRGVIADDAPANADAIITGVRAAFKDTKTKGIVLRINSPGGSPVQAGYVYDEVMRLKKLHPNVPVYAVASELCASAAYYIAASADKIYADKATLVGSIGVLMDGWGFVGTMNKLGVERRLITVGDHKGFLDPFSPMKESDKKHMVGLLDNVYQQFVRVVKEGRGARLKDNPDLFSGLVWTGEQGVALGLVDGLGSTSYVAREVIGAEDLVDFTPRQNFLDRFAERVGASAAHTLSTTLLSPGTMR